MSKFLITGVSGAGKTTIAKDLYTRGYNAVDTDRIKELSAWIERTTGKPRQKEFDTAADWVDRYDWVWDEEYLRLMLETEEKPVFLCGNASNQEKFYDLFTKVFLLEIDDQTLTKRVLSDDREHNFGKRPGELEIILGWYKDYQERSKALGAVAIDARLASDEVVNQILSQVHDS